MENSKRGLPTALKAILLENEWQPPYAIIMRMILVKNIRDKWLSNLCLQTYFKYPERQEIQKEKRTDIWKDRNVWKLKGARYCWRQVQVTHQRLKKKRIKLKVSLSLFSAKLVSRIGMLLFRGANTLRKRADQVGILDIYLFSMISNKKKKGQERGI